MKASAVQALLSAHLQPPTMSFSLHSSPRGAPHRALGSHWTLGATAPAPHIQITFPKLHTTITTQVTPSWKHPTFNNIPMLDAPWVSCSGSGDMTSSPVRCCGAALELLPLTTTLFHKICLWQCWVLRVRIPGATRAAATLHILHSLLHSLHTLHSLHSAGTAHQGGCSNPCKSRDPLGFHRLLPSLRLLAKQATLRIHVKISAELSDQ